MSKYQNTCEPGDFPAVDEGDYVAGAAHAVMVEGQTTTAAANLYGVTPGAVCMRCKRIADSLRDVRIKLHAGELYGLVREAELWMPDATWSARVQSIINDVEGSRS